MIEAMTDNSRILVIDAEERFRRILSKLFETCGYDVTTKACGVEGLAAYIKSPFPLVITDVDIPDMTSVELLQQIKRMNNQTEIIVMNNYTSSNAAIEAMRAGAYDCLAKPFKDKEVICNTVRRALEKVRLERQNQNLITMLKQHNNILKTANARLKQMATHDEMTGLLNHRYFQKKLKAEIDRAKRYPCNLSILFIDLDYFKKYNDTNGHLAGDRLLRTLGSLFRKSLRNTDIVARYGGDEFVVILVETPKAQARQIAAKLHRRVAEHPFALTDKMPGGRITISIGLATYPEDRTNSDTLLHRADQRLYDHKHKRGCPPSYPMERYTETIAVRSTEKKPKDGAQTCK